MKEMIVTFMLLAFLTFVGWSVIALFKELATVRPNVERMLLNK